MLGYMSGKLFNWIYSYYIEIYVIYKLKNRMIKRKQNQN